MPLLLQRLRLPVLTTLAWYGLLAVLVLLLVAAGARLPYLWDIPRFTDETAEAEIALLIARGEQLPLTNRDPYIGALWNYLLAAAFVAGGQSLYLPRTLVAVFGVFAIIPTYLLARSLVAGLTARAALASGAPGSTAILAGLVAGLFLALSPAHIVVNSHIAWSNCLTPLFTTLGVWLVHRAITLGRPRQLVLSGLVFGLGLQTHPVAALGWPGVAIGVALARPAWLRGPWPWLALLAAALGCANLLAANLVSGLDGLAYGGAVQSAYTGGEILTLPVYLDRLRQTLWLLTDSLGGVLAESGPLAGPFERPVGLVLAVLAAVGLEALARRRDPLVLLAIVSYVLLLPVVNGRYESSVPKVRYIAPLLPLVYATAAVAVLEVVGRVGPLVHRATGLLARSRRATSLPAPDPALAWGLRSIVAAGVLALLVLPLTGLVSYYRAAVQENRTNADLFQAVTAIEASRRPGDRVYVERAAMRFYTLGGGQLNEHLAFAAAVYGWERSAFEIPHRDAQVVRRVIGPLLVRAGVVPLIGKSYRVEPVAGGPDGNSALRVLYTRGPQPHLLTAERQEERDDVPQPARPPRTEEFVTGVTFPSSLQFAPDGRLFFNEVLEGRVRIASPSGQLQAEPFVTLPTPKGLEQGALGLALDPDFARNHLVYVFYSEADAANRPVRNRLMRFTERNGRATEPTPILGDLPINQTAAYNGDHNGGRIAFGPDGKLYVSIGEMVRRSQVPDPKTVFGKILRLNRDGSIPVDNPFGPFLTYALGFRNVFGLTFHPETGQLYATDNGPDGYDELNLVLPGRNYGYPAIEGGPGAVAGLEDPFWDSGEERLGITGLTIYSGSVFPEYAGDLFFCAFNSGALRRVRLSGPDLDQVDWVETIGRDCRLDVTTGPDGTLYFSDLARIFRLAR